MNSCLALTSQKGGDAFTLRNSNHPYPTYSNTCVVMGNIPVGHNLWGTMLNTNEHDTGCLDQSKTWPNCRGGEPLPPFISIPPSVIGDLTLSSGVKLLREGGQANQMPSLKLMDRYGSVAYNFRGVQITRPFPAIFVFDRDGSIQIKYMDLTALAERRPSRAPPPVLLTPVVGPPGPPGPPDAGGIYTLRLEEEYDSASNTFKPYVRIYNTASSQLLTQFPPPINAAPPSGTSMPVFRPLMTNVDIIPQRWGAGPGNAVLVTTVNAATVPELKLVDRYGAVVYDFIAGKITTTGIIDFTLNGLGSIQALIGPNQPVQLTPPAGPVGVYMLKLEEELDTVTNKYKPYVRVYNETGTQRLKSFP